MTSMGVEAGRDAMKGLPSALCIWKRLILEYLWFDMIRGGSAPHNMAPNA